MEQNLVEALDTKKQYFKVTSNCKEVLDNISSQESWSWACVPGFTQEAEAARDHLQSKLAQFGKNFLVLETKDLKKMFDEASMTIELEAFSTSLKPAIAKLQRSLKTLIGQHRVKLEAHEAGRGSAS